MHKILGTLLTCCSVCFSQTNVLTYRNDNARTGQNLSETILAPASVNSSSFGKLFTVAMDGKVDAQPLYVSAVPVPTVGTRNVVYAATENDSVYAFDADSGKLYWQVSLLASGETASDSRSCGQVSPIIGITATPLVDPTAGPNGTIYLVAMSKDAAGSYHQRLHALNITTGAEEFSGPVNIQASYPGSGDNSSGGKVIFDPKQYKARPGLMLLNGTIYIGWGSHCDIRPYTGWLMGYDRLTLQQQTVIDFAPNGSEAALWGSGGGVDADALGNIFVQLANGTFDTSLTPEGFPQKEDFGNSFVKLTLSSGKLAATDYWTMQNTVAESNSDEDLGSGGLLLLPDLVDASGNTRHLATGAGKDGNVYVFDRDNMGKFDPSNNSTLYQELPGGLAGGEFASPAWFNGNVYYGAVGDAIRSFPVKAALLSSTPSSKTAKTFGYPGATPAISATGTSNAILWAAENSNPAVLHAYSANNLATELYNSNQAASGRDQFGIGNKFITPTVANGKVFVGTTNSVAAFGLLPGAATGIPLSFIPITPCRVADTRNQEGAFGGPELSAGSTRSFAITGSNCQIPPDAAAYSLNLTVVPDHQLGYLTAWATGEFQPTVSTLNSDGRIKANAAIVPAGTSGSVSFYVTDPTHLIVDVTGYFVPVGNGSALAFYPVTPCRLVDTRQGTGPLAGPFLVGGVSRSFPLESGACNIPAGAQAYSLNLTAVPHGSLEYLSAWPAGETQPLASALNAPSGAITANAALIPAGTNGDVSVYSTNDTDLVIDVNGYFAAPGNGGLSLYTVTPCRLFDSRNPPGAQPFNGSIALNAQSAGCGMPPSAEAYVLNATVVPAAGIQYLTLGTNNQSPPNFSTLNAPDGAIASNMAIVSTTTGAVNAFSSQSTYLVLDTASYFAP
jgi:outer membrane protein assembly factor BamB